MFKSTVHVHLPAVETQRKESLGEWVGGLFGSKPDLRSGYVQTTVTTFSLMQGLCRALGEVGVTDVLSLLVDRRVVYLDRQGVAADLGLMWQAAEQSGVLGRAIGELHLALSHLESGLHTLIDVGMKSTVPKGQPEIVFTLSSRVAALTVQPGETAAAYTERVKAFARDPAQLDFHRKALTSLAQRLAARLSADLPGAQVVPYAAIAELIRPAKPQIGRFRKLGWGSAVSAPRYRPVPSTSRRGAYADPFFYYWYDPYYDYTSYVVLGSLVHERTWHDAGVSVVTPEGQPLYSGADDSSVQQDWNQLRDVAFTEDGGLNVDPSIPDPGGSGDPTADAAAGASWGGSDTSSSSDASGGGSDTSSSGDSSWGGSDTSSSSSSDSSSSSSDSSSSSCGSSCSSSSSSCGSSCSSS